jgi:homoserine O-succinyltransferase
MPLVVDGAQGSAVWVGKNLVECVRSTSLSDKRAAGARSIHIALVNNMPDSAMEDTEAQFFELLDAASEGLPVRLKLFSLPNLPRNDSGQQRLNKFYFNINDLWAGQFDAVIVTGSEPRHSDLRQEAYWSVLADVFDWAEENTLSAVLSCLAAHASVLHSDGISRNALGEKLFGVFDFSTAGQHPLTENIRDGSRVPHSRWNEVRAGDLTSCGYSVLTHSDAGGADLFVKKKRNSLFVHFQGHPEYGNLTLLKEYRRDARRFLRGERDTFPGAPKGYLDAESTRLINDFERRALESHSEDTMGYFPEHRIASTLTNTWQSSAIRVYRSWLQYVATCMAERPALASPPGPGRARSAASR